MRRIRILLLIDSLVGWGEQRQPVELALNLDKERFDPTVLIYFDLSNSERSSMPLAFRLSLRDRSGSKPDPRSLSTSIDVHDSEWVINHFRSPQ